MLIKYMTPYSALVRTSAHDSPAGPAPTIATFSDHDLFDKSGFHPISKALSVIYFSADPIVTAPNPSFNVQAPSQSLSCGQTLPHTSEDYLFGDIAQPPQEYSLH